MIAFTVHNCKIRFAHDKDLARFHYFINEARLQLYYSLLKFKTYIYKNIEYRL